MRILLVITDYGSFNNFLSEVAVRLANTGHEVHVICSKLKVIDCEDKHPYTSMGIIFHYIDFPRSFNVFKQLAASKKINKKISDIHPDLINIHFTTGIFTTLIWRKPPYFLIGTIHGVGYPTVRGLKKLIFLAVEKFCFNKLDQIYLINQFDYNLVKKTYPKKAFKYHSYGVGCDFSRFNPSAITADFKANLRDRLQINDTDFVMAFTGRFVAFKGFDIVVKAMISLIKEYKDIRLLLIGGNDPAHGNGLNGFEENFCKYHPQIVKVGFTADVNIFLSISDLFIFPSEKEGMPVCIMEALAMGVPVITSNSRGCNDLIEDNYNGLLLSERPSITEARNAILKLYHDRQLLRRISQNALLKREALNRKMYVEDQVKIYANLMANVA
jgi:glycosyltransferase involved in cell wall biosynthesis